MSTHEVANDSDNIDDNVGGSVFERFFTGQTTAEYVAPKTLFMTADYVNLMVFETDEGLVMIDTGFEEAGPKVYEEIRKKTDLPLHTVIFTHGHLDHAFGLKPWIEAGEKPRIIAHKNVAERFKTYMRVGHMNAHINCVQFGIEFDQVNWPNQQADFFWPDTVYEDTLTIYVGGERFELYHAKGETDDETWFWAPERDIVCSGDLWMEMLPNCGNPQKVQRYPEGWADALEAMASKSPALLLPGHGKPIEGEEKIKQCFLNTAEALRAIVDHVLIGLNKGLPHEDILEGVKIPDHLTQHFYLDELYDKAEFIGRNVIRMYGGWWNGFSSQVIPARMADQAEEIATLAGGAQALIDRANALKDSEEKLACHLAEWAALAEPSNKAAQQCVIDVFGARAEREVSLMGRGIFTHATRKAQAALDKL